MFAHSFVPPAIIQDPDRRALPEGTGVLAHATSCREAALSFLNDSKPWGKAELVMWLMGPYAHATRCATDAYVEGERALQSSLMEIDARFVDRLIATAVRAVRRILEDELEDGTVGAFAEDVIEHGFVERCTDAEGRQGWVPTAKPRRLAERVLSLLAADYLTRSEIFESDLACCSSCGRIHFREGIRSCVACVRQHSGVITRAGGAIFSFFPEGA